MNEARSRSHFRWPSSSALGASSPPRRRQRRRSSRVGLPKIKLALSREKRTTRFHYSGRAGGHRLKSAVGASRPLAMADPEVQTPRRDLYSPWAALESTRASGTTRQTVQHGGLYGSQGCSTPPPDQRRRLLPGTGRRANTPICRIGAAPPDVSIYSILYDGRSLLLRGWFRVFLSVPRSHP